jgi:hypothetical protein
MSLGLLQTLTVLHANLETLVVVHHDELQSEAHIDHCFFVTVSQRVNADFEGARVVIVVAHLHSMIVLLANKFGYFLHFFSELFDLFLLH